MTPDAMERLAVLVERQLAGLSRPGEIEELSKLLESSPQARELYLRAMEFHVDLGAAADEKARAAVSTPTIPLPVARVGRSVESVPLPETRSQKRFLSWSVRLATASVAAGFLLVGSLFGFWLIGRIGKLSARIASRCCSVSASKRCCSAARTSRFSMACWSATVRSAT